MLYHHVYIFEFPNFRSRSWPCVAYLDMQYQPNLNPSFFKIYNKGTGMGQGNYDHIYASATGNNLDGLVTAVGVWTEDFGVGEIYALSRVNDINFFGTILAPHMTAKMLTHKR